MTVAELTGKKKYTIREACVILGVVKTTLYRYHDHGYRGARLRFTRVGRKVRVLEDDLMAFVEAMNAAEDTIMPVQERTTSQNERAADAAIARLPAAYK